MTPGQIPTFRQPSAAETPWWWQLHDESGASLTLTDFDQRFHSRGDAESWVGECWAELAEAGVNSVTLFEHERQVYGPMSLSA